MSLFDRVVGDSADYPGGGHIGGHRLAAWFHEIAGDSGQLGNNIGQRKQALIDFYSLDATEQNQLDVLITWYQSALNKPYFLTTIEQITVLGQLGVAGYLTQQDFEDRLQEARDQA